MRIAVIPARGGSKRIPRKNVKNFCGKPVIGYPIQAAINSKLFDDVIVSTEDEEIALVAKNFGASVPFMRPKNLADDYTNTNDVVKHAIQWYQSRSIEIEYVCCIYATTPFINKKYLTTGMQMLSQSSHVYAMSVTSYAFPIQRAIRITELGEVEPMHPEFIKYRSQDLEEAFHDAGQFYWGLPQAFLDDEVLFSSKTIPVVLPRYLVQDLDTPEDWLQAELMYRSLQVTEISF